MKSLALVLLWLGGGGCVDTGYPCGLAPAWPHVLTARSIEGGIRVSVSTEEFQAMQKYHTDMSAWIYSCGLEYEASTTQWGAKP